MRMFLKLISLSFVFIFTTGFYTLDAKINIKDDKSLNFYALHTINEPAFKNTDLINKKSINDLLQVEKLNNSLLKNKYKIEDFIKNNEVGYKITKVFKNIDDISSTKKNEVKFNDFLNEEFKDNSLFKVKKEGLINLYEANFIIDTKSIDKYNKSMNFEVILPSISKSNNATHISNDGLVLTWKLKENALNKINFSFEIREKRKINYILISFIVITTIIFSTILIKKNYKKD